MISALFFFIIGILFQYRCNILELFIGIKFNSNKFSTSSNIFNINDVAYEGKQLALYGGQFYVDGVRQNITEKLDQTYKIQIEGKDSSVYCLGNLHSTSDINVAFLDCKDVECQNIKGDVSSTGNIECTGIEGDVNCDGNISVDGNIDGEVHCEGKLDCLNINGDVNCDGNMNANDIKGDVNCDGNIISHFIHGSVTTENLEIKK